MRSKAAFLGATSIAVIGLTVGVASGSLGSGASSVAINLGSTDVEGGTTDGPEVSEGAIEDLGSTGVGELVNDTPKEIDDMTCEVENGTANQFDFNGKTASFTQGGTKATVNFPGAEKIDSGGKQDYTVSGMEVGEGDGAAQPTEKLKLIFTSSTPETINSVAVESNLTQGYRLSEISDLVRRGVRRAHHPVITAWVENVDSSRSIVGFAGSVNFPGDYAANILDLELQQLGGAPLAHDVSINGSDFTISNFTGRAPGSKVQIVVQFDGSPDGDPVQITLDAAFSP